MHEPSPAVMDKGFRIAMQVLLTNLKAAQEGQYANRIKVTSLQKQLTKARTDRATAISQARCWQKRCEQLRAAHESFNHEVCGNLQPSQPSHPPPHHVLVEHFVRKSKSKLPTRSSSKGPVKSAKAKPPQSMRNAMMRTRSSSKARSRRSSNVLGQPMQCPIGNV